MKLLQVIPSTNPEGGGPMESVRQISGVLSALGHSTEIASTDAPGAPWLSSLPMAVHALGPGTTSYAYTPSLVPWLRENAPRFDAVIVNGLWQYPSFAVRQALHGTQTPFFVYPHGMLDPWFKRAYPFKHLKKSLYWPLAEYRVLRDARAVLFTCEEEKLLARRSFGLYRANEIVVNFGTSVPAGDPQAQREEFLAHYPELRAKRLLLFLSRIHAKKGCDVLIEAFARVAPSDPALHLVMAGPDQTGWRASLERLATARGVAGRILWPGMLTGEDKWGAFHAAEAFVLPSHQENFGIAVAEALACGLPVLISDKVNIWREIKEDGAGLVAPDDAEGTRQSLQAWLGMSLMQKAEMGRSAERCFRRRFEVSQAAHSLIAALNPAPRGAGAPGSEGAALCQNP